MRENMAYELMEAKDDIHLLMASRHPDFATMLMVALRDWICDYYDDDNIGFEIAKAVAQGREQ
jgi:hypothetical protein